MVFGLQGKIFAVEPQYTTDRFSHLHLLLKKVLYTLRFAKAISFFKLNRKIINTIVLLH